MNIEVIFKEVYLTHSRNRPGSLIEACTLVSSYARTRCRRGNEVKIMSIAQNLTENVKSFVLKNGNEKKIIYGAFAINILFYWFYNVVIYNNNKIVINDYYQNFSTAVYDFLTNPMNLYTITYNPVSIPFRNLPSLVFYYMIFYSLPHTARIDYYVCSMSIILWNLGSCILFNKIMKLEKFKEIQGITIFTVPAVIIAFYMLNLWGILEYYMANTNVITGFFVLLGVYFFLSDRERYGYVAWSIAITFKITIIFLIIFFIFQPPFKRFLRNLMHALIPQIPNIIMFALWPNLLFDYVTFNISVDVNFAPNYFHSGDVAREFSWFFKLPLISLVIPIFLVFFIVNFILCYKASQVTFIDRLILAFLTTIVIFPDFMFCHVLFFLGVYLLWLASHDDSVFSKSTRILVGLPLLSVTYYFGTSFVPFPSISPCFFIPLLLIDYRLISSMKRNAVVMIKNIMKSRAKVALIIIGLDGACIVVSLWILGFI